MEYRTVTSCANTCLQTVDRGFDNLSTMLSITALQSNLDSMGRTIEEILEPLAGINNFLNTTAAKNLIEKLTIELVKLPLKAARNVLTGLYSVVRQIAYTAVHPLNSTQDLVKGLIRFVDQLADPATWTALGVGSMAGTLGQCCVTGAAISPLFLIVGGALAGVGLTGTAIKACLENAELNHVGARLLDSLKMLPEVAATAFLSGAIFGALQPRQPTQADIDALGNRFVREQYIFSFPEYSIFSLDSTGQLVMTRLPSGRYFSMDTYMIFESSVITPGRYVLPLPTTVPVMYTGKLRNQNSEVNPTASGANLAKRTDG